MDKPKVNYEIDLSSVRIEERFNNYYVGVWNKEGEQIWLGTSSQLAELIEKSLSTKPDRLILKINAQLEQSQISTICERIKQSDGGVLVLDNSLDAYIQHGDGTITKI
jgi:hypothetical protein